MLIFGILGVILCLGSAVILGIDITGYVNSGFILGGTFKLTKIIDVMHKLTPSLWTSTINFLNDSPASFGKTFTEFAVNLPATIIGLIFGIGLVALGFRVRRYHNG